jgi:dihydroxyacetone kinase
MADSLPKKFCDAPATLVNDSIDGLVKSSGGTLKRIDGYDRAIRVVVRADYEENVKNANRVALVTGGGSGHEPAHAGFLGQGMLTAAVCGDVFASPTVDAVLAAIKTVTGPAGCLLIIKNYTGDRLNFGLAAEKARSLYGLKVSAVVAADDTALPDAAHPRGTAGTVFVHRFAGKLAEEGKSLEEILERTAAYERGIVSVGASLTTCSLPGVAKDTRLDGAEYELGLGIHGEPGAAKLPLEPATAVLDRMIAVLVAGAAARNLALPSTEFTLLVNNLGGVPPIEMTFLSG